MVSVEEAVREAIDTDEGPVVLGDLADSGGAGTPGDGTAILAELLKQNAQRAVVGNIADPAAVQRAVQAGVGKPVTVTVGGKVDKFHGDPVEISGRVRVIHDGVFTASTRFNAGRAAIRSLSSLSLVRKFLESRLLLRVASVKHVTRK